MSRKKRRVFSVVFAFFTFYVYHHGAEQWEAKKKKKKRPAMWIIRRLIDTDLYQQLFSARTGLSSRTPETERRTELGSWKWEVWARGERRIGPRLGGQSVVLGKKTMRMCE
jgi:hypothetical protein